MPTTDKWSDAVKYVILENSVTSRLHLKQVEDNTNKIKTHSKSTLSYDDYRHLLKYAAQNYDQNTRSNPHRAVRKVHLHEVV